jgi:hypothetical protein
MLQLGRLDVRDVKSFDLPKVENAAGSYANVKHLDFIQKKMSNI